MNSFSLIFCLYLTFVLILLVTVHFYDSLMVSQFFLVFTKVKENSFTAH